MINRILHSWSFNMKFMKLVGYFGVLLAKARKIPRNYPNSFIYFILNDHSCKILYLFSMAMVKYGMELGSLNIFGI